MPRTIKLMADYGCSPLWETGAEGGNVPLEELPLRAELREALRAWADAYDRTLNEAYPPDSGFADTAEEDAFEAEGERIWRALRQELGAEFTVAYYSDLHGLRWE